MFLAFFLIRTNCTVVLRLALALLSLRLAQLSSAQLSSAQLSSAQLSSVQFSSAQLSSVHAPRLSTRSGSNRFKEKSVQF